MTQLNIRQINGKALGELTIKDYDNEPSNNGVAKLTFETAKGVKTSLDQAKVTSLNLLGADTVVDSTATDVAGIVADFNALLAVLRTAEVIQ